MSKPGMWWPSTQQDQKFKVIPDYTEVQGQPGYRRSFFKKKNEVISQETHHFVQLTYVLIKTSIGKLKGKRKTIISWVKMKKDKQAAHFTAKFLT